MKKFTLLFTALILIGMFANSQEIVLAGWTFPGSSAESDTGVIVNMGNEIATLGGTSDLDFKNGLESKAAQVTGWDDGMDVKAWVIEISTANFENLTISSVQQSGGNDPGPKNYKLQYSIESDNWVNIPDGVILCENDWTTSAVENLALPSECNNVELVKIRWIMTSNDASGGGGTVAATGKNKIDNVFIRGEVINAINDYTSLNSINIFPNPTSGVVNIKADDEVEMIQVYSPYGGLVMTIELNRAEVKFDLTGLPKGSYFLKTKFRDNASMVVNKIVIN